MTAAAPSPSGRTRPPIAARIEACDTDGLRLLDLTVALAGPRTRGLPEAALSMELAQPRLREVLAGRHRIAWHAGDLLPLRAALPPLEDGGQHEYSEHGFFSKAHEADPMGQRVAAWRGEIDPRTRDLRRPLPPGRPDRMALLLRRMAAADHNPERRDT